MSILHERVIPLPLNFSGFYVLHWTRSFTKTQIEYKPVGINCDEFELL